MHADHDAEKARSAPAVDQNFEKPLNALCNFNANLQIALMDKLCEFLDELVPLNIPMLHAADITRDAFKSALLDAAFKD